MKMWEPIECPGTEELKDRLQTAREKLTRQQMLLKEKKLPVLVLMEGWGTAGKGNCIGRVIQNIDPRFFNVESLEKKTEEEKRKPFLYRYFKRLPEAGKFAFFDSGWMDETVQEKLSLVYRFGVRIYFGAPNKKEFQNIVTTLAERYGVTMPAEELLMKANAWELSHGGLTGRTAQQFIDHVLGTSEEQ